MTIVWFIVWLIANNVGGHEPLLFSPVNAWTATLILAIGLDFAAAHARHAEEPLGATPSPTALGRGHCCSELRPRPISLARCWFGTILSVSRRSADRRHQSREFVPTGK
jgi:hypothetical protein